MYENNYFLESYGKLQYLELLPRAKALKFCQRNKLENTSIPDVGFAEISKKNIFFLRYTKKNLQIL